MEALATPFPFDEGCPRATSAVAQAQEVEVIQRMLVAGLLTLLLALPRFAHAEPG